MTATGDRWARGAAIGALVLWGLLHLVGGIAEVATVERDGGQAALELLGSSAEIGDRASDPGAVAESVIAFHGFLIACAGIAVTALTVASARGRRPSTVLGPLAIVAVADAGLLAFLVLPGYTPLSEAFWGPLLLLVALVGAARGGLLTPEPRENHQPAS